MKNRSESLIRHPFSQIPYILFCISGFAALIAEVAVIRRAGQIFGVSSWAMAVVLAVFFGGMALGSILGGRIVLRQGSPLRLYGLIEAGGALGLLAVPWLLSISGLVFARVYDGLFWSPLLLTGVRAVLVILSIAVPAILMGMTFPVMARTISDDETAVLPRLSLLYWLNSFGAFAGALACGVVLLPSLGVFWCVYLSAGLFLAVSVVALGYSRRLEARPSPAQELSTPRIRPPMLLIASFAASGFSALAGEVLWARFLSLLIHNTVYTYTFSIAAVLLGSALGGVLAWLFGSRISDRGMAYGIALCLIGCFTVVAISIPAPFFSFLMDTSSLGMQAFLLIGLMLLPAIASGFAYPLGIRLASIEASSVSVGVGILGFSNILGGVAGSIAAGFIIIPAVGLQWGLLCIAGLMVFVGCAVLIRFGRFRIVGLGWVFVLVSLSFAVPFLTGARIPEDYIGGSRVHAFKEGIHSTMAAIRQPGFEILEIDRLWQGETRRTRQVVAAHVPAILHGGALGSVCVIGLGAGQTAGRFLMYDVDRLDCVDIEPELPIFIRTHFGADWLADARVRVIHEDGRNWLKNSSQKYGVISIEVGQTFRPGVAGFYTQDFYRYAQQKLAPGGIVCQFLPMGGLSPVWFSRAIASFIAVFPESVLWYNADELLLIGSNRQIGPISSERLNASLRVPSVRDDMSFSYWGGSVHWLSNPEVFMGGYICGKKGLQRLAGSEIPLREDRPDFEYAAARQVEVVPYTGMLASVLEPVSLLFYSVSDSGRDARCAEIQKINLGDIIASELLRSYRSRPVPELLKVALEYNPYNIELNGILGDLQRQSADYASARASYVRILTSDPGNIQALNNCGGIACEMGDLSSAEALYRKLVALEPGYIKGLCNLGKVQGMQKKFEDAEYWFNRALEVDPGCAEAREALSILKELEQGALWGR